MKEWGQACGRDDDKFWVGLLGEGVRLTDKEEPLKRNKITRMLQLPIVKVQQVYDKMQKPFGLDLFDVENSSWIYTIGENKLENGKRYIGLYKRNRTNELVTKMVLVDAETGLIYKIVDYSDNSMVEFLEYQSVDDKLICSKVKKIKEDLEMLVSIKDVKIGAPFDESLLKKTAIIKASDHSDAKKSRKRRAMGSFVEGLTMGIVSHQEKGNKWYDIVSSVLKDKPSLVNNLNELHFDN